MAANYDIFFRIIMTKKQIHFFYFIHDTDITPRRGGRRGEGGVEIGFVRTHKSNFVSPYS